MITRDSRRPCFAPLCVARVAGSLIMICRCRFCFCLLALAQTCRSKLQGSATQAAQLAALQQEGAELLQASNVDLVIKAGPLKTTAQQMADEQLSAQKASEVGLQQLNESISALHKTARAVPLVQVNPLGSQILSESAEDLQRMFGDSMKLVSCSACVLPVWPRQRVADDRFCLLAGFSLCCRSVCWLDDSPTPSCCIVDRAMDGRMKTGQPNASARATHSRSSRSATAKSLTRRVCAAAPHLRDDADWSRLSLLVFSCACVGGRQRQRAGRLPRSRVVRQPLLDPRCD